MKAYEMFLAKEHIKHETHFACYHVKAKIMAYLTAENCDRLMSII